ncbi:MAG: sugar ABC transporter substrate-binding protein, partial [Clostridia bacterium]
VGVSENTQHKAEAAKLVNFIMSADINGRLAATANAFPGNTTATPDYSAADPMFQKAFEIYQQSYACNEFVGLPVAEELMRIFDEELQTVLDGKGTVQEGLDKIQTKWVAEF